MTDEEVFLEFMTRLDVSATIHAQRGEREYVLDKHSSEKLATHKGQYLSFLFKDDGELFMVGLFRR